MWFFSAVLLLGLGCCLHLPFLGSLPDLCWAKSWWHRGGSSLATWWLRAPWWQSVFYCPVLAPFSWVCFFAIYFFKVILYVLWTCYFSFIFDTWINHCFTWITHYRTLKTILFSCRLHFIPGYGQAIGEVFGDLYGNLFAKDVLWMFRNPTRAQRFPVGRWLGDG